jgi:hypothetical protein
MCVQSQRHYFGERHHIVVTDKIAELLARLGRDQGVTEEDYLKRLSRHPNEDQFTAFILSLTAA